MDLLIAILPILPLFGLLIGQIFENKQEKPIYYASFLPVAGVLGILIVLSIQWVTTPGSAAVLFQGPLLYHSAQSEFRLLFYMDAYSWTYVMVSTIITLLVLRFSRSYVHREKGFKRFFSNILFFYFGLIIVLIAGNLEVLFVGWEIIGVTSFFLIGFYRERYLPVKNALKVVSLYRIADIGLLASIWICHHYFGHSIHFDAIPSLQGGSQEHILNETFYQYFIPIVFIIAAMVKSAQFPFSSWVSRAMEGPTTSSAIFYGALSLHIGVFLLIRVAPLWESNLAIHFIIGGIGLITTIVASLTARVQPSIKVQIGYSSVAQVGLMFIWVALGWYWLAMVHFGTNAFLRCYQLLVSPSVLSYRIHDQFYHFRPAPPIDANTFFGKLKLTVYMLGIKEFGLDSFMYRYLWQPLKKAGNMLSFMDIRTTYIMALPLFAIGFYGVFYQEYIPQSVYRYIPEFFGLVGLLFILKAFVERKNALNAWVLIMVNQLFQSLTFIYNEEFDFSQLYLFLSGIILCTMIGIYAINHLRMAGASVSLNRFHGHFYDFPRLTFLFAVASLGLAGFPITPTFIGEDLMLGHIHENQFPLLTIMVLNIILDGLVIFRIYSRLFLGPNTNGYHEVACKSS